MSLDFANIPLKKLAAMRQAGEMISKCQRILDNNRQNIVEELLRFADDFVEWTHVPEKDVHDTRSFSQYYYHAHPKSKDGTNPHDDEHGHFHTFVRGNGMKENIHPTPLQNDDPQLEEKREGNEIVSHIIGVTMDEMGKPCRLFTTNRWVTGENWFAADDVIRMLDQFEMDTAYPSWPVNLWLTNMLQLFRPQIEKLLHERDETIADWQETYPDTNVFEDHALEITSYCEINLEKQLLMLNQKETA